MMKKTAENRYPNSAILFKFCKEALELRYKGNVKVIDQDVGSILGYDPADCSHWKKGKKNIHALTTLRSIAEHLHLDESLLIDIAAGKIGLEEALFEYKGYGHFALQGAYLESLKKDFFKNPSKWQKDSSNKTFEELFQLDREGVIEAANRLLKAGNFNEAPIYMPELCQQCPQVRLEKSENQAKSLAIQYSGEGKSLKMTISYKDSEMRPYVRFLLAKHLFKFLCQTDSEIHERFGFCPAEVQEIQSNIFASVLLIPQALLRQEVERLNSAADIILQLAEAFWVSKSLINQRLKDYVEYFS